MKDLKWTEDKSNIFNSSYNCKIWDKELDVKIKYTKVSKDISKSDLINCEIAIIEMIERINKSDRNIINFLMTEGVFELAESWLKSQAVIIKDNISYFKNEKDQLIPVDLKKTNFISYICFYNLEIMIEDTELKADMFLNTIPDCFSEHLIEIFLLREISSDKYRISFNGIVPE